MLFLMLCVVIVTTVVVPALISAVLLMRIGPVVIGAIVGEAYARRRQPIMYVQPWHLADSTAVLDSAEVTEASRRDETAVAGPSVSRD